MAIAANGGELVSTAVIPSIDGDLTHLAGGLSSVMNPTLATGAIEREWTTLDLAVLADLGYSTVPEPFSWTLLLTASGALATISFRRHKKLV
jgi:hypothetical protein